MPYQPCQGKADGHNLGDGTWCWAGKRGSRCPLVSRNLLYNVKRRKIGECVQIGLILSTISHFVAETTTPEATSTSKDDETATTIQGIANLNFYKSNIELAKSYIN